MQFKQLTIFIDSKNADTLSDIFFDLGALSVSIADKFEGTEFEQAIFNEPGMIIDTLWEHSKITVLLDDSVNITELIEEATLNLGVNFYYELAQIDNQDWVKLTQDQFQPIKINELLYIVPSWHDISSHYSGISINLDPGLAFGTGSHATTYMCLEWITKHIKANIHNLSVLDYGCGSGILAIAAKKFGANEVYGTDIDEQAIEASILNATKNNVLIDFVLPKKLPNKQFDILIANILSNPLRILAPNLASLTKDILLLSGILTTQSDELSQIYSEWFKVTVKNNVDGWTLLECIKK